MMGASSVVVVVGLAGGMALNGQMGRLADRPTTD